LLAALRNLPVEQQMILELHYWEGIEIGALAEILQSPAVTIRSRLHRARIAPRDRMLREPDTAKVAETLETARSRRRRSSRDGTSQAESITDRAPIRSRNIARVRSTSIACG
jgi:hypothetical protein